MGRIGNFFKELRRRHVFTVAVLYIVAAWASIQVVDLAMEAGYLRGWSLRNAWNAAFIGFPLALIVGWFYDVSRRGIVRTWPCSSRHPSVPRHSAAVCMAERRSAWVRSEMGPRGRVGRVGSSRAEEAVCAGFAPFSLAASSASASQRESSFAVPSSADVFSSAGLSLREAFGRSACAAACFGFCSEDPLAAFWGTFRSLACRSHAAVPPGRFRDRIQAGLAASVTGARPRCPYRKCAAVSLQLTNLRGARPQFLHPRRENPLWSADRSPQEPPRGSTTYSFRVGPEQNTGCR